MTTHLVPVHASPALRNAIALWADATTAPAAARRADLLRDKTAMVGAFFTYTPKPPEQVTEIDVKAWQAALEDRGLAPATVYGYLSRLSSFYQWAAQDPALAQRIPRNPVRLARPKAPRAYQTESTQALPTPRWPRCSRWSSFARTPAAWPTSTCTRRGTPTRAWCW
jgi:hypothetical protein